MTEEQAVESDAVANPPTDAVPVGDADAGQATAVAAKGGDIVFMMAACEDATKRPDMAEFVQVEPRNLSATSISFYCNDAPTRESIVLLMGKLDEDPICVSAAVTSCNEGFWERKRRYLVGCELTGRL